LFWDPVPVAAPVSRLTGRICTLMYHRTDGTRHARLGPPQVHRLRATLRAGQVVAFCLGVAAVRLDARHGCGEITTARAAALPLVVQQTVANLGYEEFFFKSMVSSPFNVEVGHKILRPLPIDMNTVSFRSVHIQPARRAEGNGVDGIAARMGQDPRAMRMPCLRMARAKALLQRVADAASWGRTMAPGFAHGLAVHQASHPFTACSVELDGRDASQAKVVKATFVVDAGKALIPTGYARPHARGPGQRHPPWCSRPA
jgi:isoquinoline 1-oxidoreductase subunit beta